MPEFDTLSLTNKYDGSGEEGDRFENIYGSNKIDFDNLNRKDAMTILKMMPNKRYSNIIRMLYLEHKTLAEAAEALGMTMKNFYNKEKLAKEQYERVLRKEAHYG